MHPSYFVTHTHITCNYRIIFRLRVLVKLLQLVCWSLSPKDQHFKCLSKTAPTPPELMSFSAQINKSSASFVLSVHKIFTREREISNGAVRETSSPGRRCWTALSRSLAAVKIVSKSWPRDLIFQQLSYHFWPCTLARCFPEQLLRASTFSWRWGSCLAWGASLPLGGKGSTWSGHLVWMPLEVVCFDLGDGKRCVGTGQHLKGWRRKGLG